MRVRPVRLRYHRTRLGLTQADIARMVGVAESTIIALENGHRKTARATTLGRLCQTFDVPLEDIVWMDEEVDEQAEEPAVEAS